MVAKTRGSNCYLEFISNSNVTDNSTSWRRNLSIIFFRTFRTNTNRTDHCSVRVRLEQNFLEPLLVRFEPNTNRTNRTNSNLHCSASHLWLHFIEQIEWVPQSIRFDIY